MRGAVGGWLDSGASLDAGVLLVLGLALLWGAIQGFLKQALRLLVVLVSLRVASFAGPRLDPHLAKVVDLDAAGRSALAWVVAWGGSVVLGGVLLHALHAPLARIPRWGGWDRVLGALTAGVKGVVVLAVAFYAAMGSLTPGEAPAVFAAARESRSAVVFARFEAFIGPLLRLPPAVAARAREVGRDVGGRSRS
jgi:uncharacterized membrane protein required for colicin V production